MILLIKFGQELHHISTFSSLRENNTETLIISDSFVDVMLKKMSKQIKVNWMC